MIQIHTNNSIQSIDDTHTKFNEIVQIIIKIRGISTEQKNYLLNYFNNSKPVIFQMETSEGPRSLMIELSYERPFQVSKKEFSSIQTFSSTMEQKKDLKKISKLFHSEFEGFHSIREKQMVLKLYKMYVKELKNGTIGKSKTDFKNFLTNLLEN